MQDKNMNFRIAISIFVALVLVVLSQPLLAVYNDPQGRFSLEPPEGWQVQILEDRSGVVSFTAPDGVTSLIILPRDAPESANLDSLLSEYEQMLRESIPGLSVEALRADRISIAGRTALLSEYSIEREQDRRARVMVAVLNPGRLSLTLAATVSETEFAQVEPLLRSCFQTLRFPSFTTRLATDVQAKLEILEQARRIGVMGDDEYMRKRDELTGQSGEVRREYIRVEPLRLRYNVQPGYELNFRMTLKGKLSTEILPVEGALASENLIAYELVSKQRVESVEDDGSFVAKIEPIPDTITISIDGEPQELPYVIPAVSVMVTRSGEILESGYITPSGESRLSGEMLGFTGISSMFPQFPREEIMVGDIWKLSPRGDEEGFQGIAELLGFEQVGGHPCARIQIRSNVPVSMPEQVKKDLAVQGLNLDGKVHTDMIQCFDLETGWSLSGNGKTIYEMMLLRDGVKLSHTTYDFDVDFTAAF